MTKNKKDLLPPKLLKIKVSRVHIKKGKKGSTKSCPIARAIRSLGYKNIAVSSCDIQINDHVYDIPDKVSDFIEQFDDGKEVKPFEFTARQYGNVENE